MFTLSTVCTVCSTYTGTTSPCALSINVLFLLQLYMLPDIRKGVLEFNEVSDLYEDLGDDDEKPVFGPHNRKESGEVSP